MPGSKPRSRLARQKTGSQDLSDAPLDAGLLTPGEDPLYDPSEAPAALRTVAPKAQPQGRALSSSSSSNLVRERFSRLCWRMSLLRLQHCVDGASDWPQPWDHAHAQQFSICTTVRVMMHKRPTVRVSSLCHGLQNAPTG